MKELRKEIEKNNCKELGVEEIARRAGLQEMYDTYYRLLSDDAHTLPRSIERFVLTDKHGEVAGFDWGPNDDGFEYAVSTAIEVLVRAMVYITKLFNMDKAEQFSELDSALRTLVSPSQT